MYQYAVRKRDPSEPQEVTENWINHNMENGWELFSVTYISSKQIMYIFSRWIDKHA